VTIRAIRGSLSSWFPESLIERKDAEFANSRREFAWSAFDGRNRSGISLRDP